MRKFICLVSSALLLAACSHKNTVADTSANTPVTYPTYEKVPVKPRGGDTNMSIPNATAFRMSGDYANNVAVTLNDNGELLYFPAPTDITADSAPVELGDGWWLNCQGLAPNSVFTNYTFAEYAELPETPSPSQIKSHIIPGAKVVGFVELPMKLNEALDNISEAKQAVKGF